MTESIEGRYGGVGLVIAGIPNSARPPMKSATPTTTTAPVKAVIENFAPDQPLTNPPPNNDDLTTTPISNNINNNGMTPVAASATVPTSTISLEDYDSDDMDEVDDDADKV